MSTIETWQQAMQPNEGDVLCMDDVEVYRQWLSEVHDDKCPFCGQQLISRRAIVCENSACLFKTVTKKPKNLDSATLKSIRECLGRSRDFQAILRLGGGVPGYR